MRIQGKVSWYDKRDGIVADSSGNEYYIDKSVLIGLEYLKDSDLVTFERNLDIKHFNGAKNVELDFVAMAKRHKLEQTAPEMFELLKYAASMIARTPLALNEEQADKLFKMEEIIIKIEKGIK